MALQLMGCSPELAAEALGSNVDIKPAGVVQQLSARLDYQVLTPNLANPNPIPILGTLHPSQLL